MASSTSTGSSGSKFESSSISSRTRIVVAVLLDAAAQLESLDFAAQLGVLKLSNRFDRVLARLRFDHGVASGDRERVDRTEQVVGRSVDLGGVIGMVVLPAARH